MTLLKHFKITAMKSSKKELLCVKCPSSREGHVHCSMFLVTTLSPPSLLRFLIITDHFLKSPELVKAMYAKMSSQER